MVKAHNSNPKGFWKPGQSGNPAGRKPNEPCLTTQLRMLLLLSPSEIRDFKPATGAQEVALVWYQALKKSNPRFLVEALERLEGRVPLPIAGVDEEGRPERLRIEIVRASKASE